MSPLTNEQLKQKREANHNQILHSALKVFSRRGLIGTKMSMVAEEAGMSPGQLYRFFKSKDEIFTILVHEAMQESVNGMEAICSSSGAPMDKLKLLTHTLLNEGGHYYFMLIHQARTSDEVPEKVNRIIDEYSMDKFVEILLPLFREGQESGQFAEGKPEKIIASYLTILSGLMTLNIPFDDEYQMPDTELLLRTVTP